MELLYTPWMSRFLRGVADAKSEILLVSPFVKLSLVRPLLLALPANREIRLTVVTRLSAITFRQLASDLSALELLLARPGTPGSTELYRMDRLHAKIYAFDRSNIYIGSSNLSITGMERNLEAVISVVSEPMTASVYSELRTRGAFEKRVSAEDLRLVATKLVQAAPSFELVNTEANASIESNEQDATELEADATDFIELPVQVDSDTATRHDQIQNFLRTRLRPELNTLSGRPFESPEIAAAPHPPEWRLSVEGASAAQKDLNRLKEELLPAVGVAKEEWVEPALSVFVDQNWCNVFRSSLQFGFQKQAFLDVGRQGMLFHLSVLFAKQLAYEGASAAGAAVALATALGEIDYESVLRQRSLSVLLHLGDVSVDSAKERFWSIVGLYSAVHGPDAAGRHFRSILADNISISDVRGYQLDPKTWLQAVANEMCMQVRYQTTRAGGPDEKPIFVAVATIGNKSARGVEVSSKQAAEVSAATALINLLGRPAPSPIRSQGRVRRRYFLSKERAEECRRLADRLAWVPPTSVALLDMATTHLSAANENPAARTYQRLAFVGAHLCEYLLSRDIVAEVGWIDSIARPARRFGQQSLTANALSPAFDNLGLESIVRLGKGQATQQMPNSIKVDVVQSLLAVSYLWGGFEVANRFWKEYVRPGIQLKGLIAVDDVDPISVLQERCAKDGRLAPEYQTVRLPSPEHAPRFEVAVRVDGEVVGRGVAGSKKDAKKIAARAALKHEKLRESPQTQGE